MKIMKISAVICALTAATAMTISASAAKGSDTYRYSSQI